MRGGAGREMEGEEGREDGEKKGGTEEVMKIKGFKGSLASEKTMTIEAINYGLGSALNCIQDITVKKVVKLKTTTSIERIEHLP